MHKLFLTKGSRDYFALRNDLKDYDESFKKSIYQLSKAKYSVTDFVESYKNKSIRAIRIVNKTTPKNEPILICAVKNDLNKIKAQIDHHRKIGIKHFAYIDNMSSDGTLEWLNEQNDISLFVAEEYFNDSRKFAWRRQVMDVFGYERWYIVLDSDEFLCYPGIEEIPIGGYIDYLEDKQICSLMTPMIDMYSKSDLFIMDDSKSFFDEYCYFDADSYTQYRYGEEVAVGGGPRTRLLGQKFKLSKYSMLKACSATIMGNHTVYPEYLRPVKEQKGAKAFLLHYKFLPDDIIKYREMVKTGKYDYYGNENVKLSKKAFDAYAQVEEKNFIYEGSQKLNSSMDLLKINICDSQFFKDFLKYTM